jgi:hypothetical protein
MPAMCAAPASIAAPAATVAPVRALLCRAVSLQRAASPDIVFVSPGQDTHRVGLHCHIISRTPTPLSTLSSRPRVGLAARPRAPARHRFPSPFYRPPALIHGSSPM